MANDKRGDERDPIFEAYRRYHGRRRGWWVLLLMSFDALFHRRRDGWSNYRPRSPRNSIILPPEQER